MQPDLENLRRENAALRAALAEAVYQVTHLSSAEETGSYTPSIRREVVDGWRALIAGSPDETTGVRTDSERLRWLANTVLACDYGDNHHPAKLVGWRVLEFISPVMYGASIAKAIDAAMAQEKPKRRPEETTPVIPIHISKETNDSNLAALGYPVPSEETTNVEKPSDFS